jgi:hypothetical protein
MNDYEESIASQTQRVLDQTRAVLLQTYEEMDPDGRARLLARSVLAGIDPNSATIQALAGMVFLDQEAK